MFKYIDLNVAELKDVMSQLCMEQFDRGGLNSEEEEMEMKGKVREFWAKFAIHMQNSLPKQFTDPEEAEKERIANIEKNIRDINSIGDCTYGDTHTSSSIRKSIEALDHISCYCIFDEFYAEATEALIRAREALTKILAQKDREELEAWKLELLNTEGCEYRTIPAEERLEKLRVLPSLQ